MCLILFCYIVYFLILLFFSINGDYEPCDLLHVLVTQVPSLKVVFAQPFFFFFFKKGRGSRDMSHPVRSIILGSGLSLCPCNRVHIMFTDNFAQPG